MLTKEPSVTVLVTVRNSANTIKKCVDSILKLNYKNKKVYVTDAYSTDGTWEILKGYGKKIRTERVRGNIAKAHNHMIRRCNTDFVALTDADCVVDKDWLKYLIEEFKSNDIIAAGGFIKTPGEVNKLQYLLGLELKNRFGSLPKYVWRLPTMSLCIRTEYAKKVPFDENFDVAQETEWGYRITKIGKIVFVPRSIVSHYHRSSWKAYFRQQFRYAEFAFRLYFEKKNLAKLIDGITKSSMLLELLLIYFGALSLLLGFYNGIFLGVSRLLFAILLVDYIINALKLSRNLYDVLLLLIIFAIRNIAWCVGIIVGIFKDLFG
jgi:cellulose synthase/poly-beta-1,6-N-acetylglucosamine synthase-like glycosyltransferase